MLREARLGRNVALNWVALATSFAGAFFLSPLVVHQLGNVAYGVWTLVNSITGYMGLFDLGFRGAVTRFVAQHHARGEHDQSSRVLSTALWTRLWVGLFLIVASIGLGQLAVIVFHIPPEMASAARLAIAVTGANLAVNLVLGVFGGVLVALQRFDLLSGVSIAQTVLRVAGVVWLLKAGSGIVGLAVWELAVVVLINTCMTALTLRVYRDLRVLFRPERLVLRQLWGYSSYAFLFSICGQITYYTDNLVVGFFLSAGAVTFFSIAGSLREYSRQLVTTLGTIVFPLASNLDARGRHDALRRLLILGTRATLLIGGPIQVALFFRGHTFISLWLGSEYASISGGVLRILLIGQVFVTANYISYNVACGLGKNKAVALVAAAEATANLVLSVVLVRFMGLNGVAWGTVIPNLAVHLVFWPRYICRIVKIPVGQYLWQAWMRPWLAIIPFGLACYLADRAWTATNLIHFITQMTVLLPTLALGIVLSFPKEVWAQFRSQPKWFTERWDAALEAVKRAI
jgi:O-antigen/teichoic acid export membrane protein